MRTASRAVALLLAIIVVPALAGCGGDPEPGPTRPTRDSRPAPTNADGDVDVCGLVPMALRKMAFPGDTVPTTQLAAGSENIVVCGTPGTATLELGYAVADGATMPKPDGDQVTRLRGFGDRAVIEKNVGPPGKIVDATLWAEQDGTTFYVRDSAIFNTGGTAVGLATAKQVLTALLSRVTPAIVKQTLPVVLGPHCPPADSSAVTDVVGTVSTARGGAEGSDEPECQYLGKGGTRISIDVLVQDGVEKDFFDSSYQKKIAMSGTRSAWTAKQPDSPGQVSLSWTTATDVLWYLDATPLTFGRDYADGSGSATLTNAQALGRAFMKANPDVGR